MRLRLIASPVPPFLSPKYGLLAGLGAGLGFVGPPGGVCQPDLRALTSSRRSCWCPAWTRWTAMGIIDLEPSLPGPTWREARADLGRALSQIADGLVDRSIRIRLRHYAPCMTCGFAISRLGSVLRP